MTGDLLEYSPGQRVDVEVVADPNGEVATRGMGVEIVGEGRSYTQVQLTQGPDSYGLGHISTDPEEYDENETYAAGDSVGETSVFLYHPVVLLEPDDTYTPAASDLVGWDAGGVVSGWTEPTDTNASTASPMGVVFATGTKDFGSAGKAAVAKFF